MKTRRDDPIRDRIAGTAVASMLPGDTRYLYGMGDGCGWTTNDTGDGYPTKAAEVYLINRLR